jgi:uncharacterized protein YerC
MSSIFFQISGIDFIEAVKIYDNPGKQFALRIITFQNGREYFVFLPDVTLNELSVLASILRLQIIPTLRNHDDFRRYLHEAAPIYYY